MVFAISTVPDDTAAGPGGNVHPGGRVILMSDNSPEALILPTDYNSFIRTSDDYYNRWEIATFAG